MIYQKGNAFNELLNCKDALSDKGGFDLAVDFTENKTEVSDFRHYKYYHIWAGLLLKNGAEIKTHLGKIQKDVNYLTDSFLSHKSNLDAKQRELINFQISIRDFEHDSYDFINTYSVTDVDQKSTEILTILSVVEEINRTYDRIYKHIIQKISNISNSRVSYASLFLSAVAIAIALLSIFK